MMHPGHAECLPASPESARLRRRLGRVLARCVAAAAAVVGTGAFALAAPVPAAAGQARAGSGRAAVTSGRPARADPAWAVQSVPGPIVANGHLWAVSCASATACTAVGDYINSAGARVTLAERWNGTSWSVQATPNPAGTTDVSLSAVSCPSATACTAAGDYTDSAGTDLTLAESWNGTTWSVQATPNPAGAQGSSLSGISCPSATACTAAGSYTNSAGNQLMLAERWNGTSWSVQATPNPAGSTGSSLSGVSCSSATACTAVGGYSNSHGTGLTLAERWNGTSWSVQATPKPARASATLGAVSCPSATACTAIGDYTNSGSVNQLMLAESWNGTTWTIQATPKPAGSTGSSLSGVSCSSATACTAVGGYTNSAGKGVTLAERWNGTSWSVQATPVTGGGIGLNGVSCSSATACTAAGSYFDSAENVVTLAERWNGTRWSVQATPNPAGARGSSLSSVTCSSATACTAVGFSGILLGQDDPLAERWNGTSWSIQATPSPAGSASGLTGVSCPTATACAAVGFSVNATSNQTLAERWNGTTWSIQATPNPAGETRVSLNAVSCPSATACTAIGDYTNSAGTDLTLAERWNGTSWSVQATPNPAGATGSSLSAVSCPSATACTAAGSYTNSAGTQVTLAESWNGTTWTIQATPKPAGSTGSSLSGVSCTSAAACTAAGSYTDSAGTTLTLAEGWDGTSWSIQATPNPACPVGSFLNGVSCTSATACTAAGDTINGAGNAVTLAERWNGTTWTIQATPSSGLSAALNGVSCTSATACTAAGGYQNTVGRHGPPAPGLPLAERYS